MWANGERIAAEIPRKAATQKGRRKSRAMLCLGDHMVLLGAVNAVRACMGAAWWYGRWCDLYLFD